ncbi:MULTISPECIES: Gfo/Idh/MocA family protein [Maribacter]|uniref:Gfo/Idh/MocA family oxidoreductase n=1 Tax=Maribacter flavus TaxID=1658664 RepID=A0ABU7IIK8_9FLAO|nr:MULTISPECIES: Gfo/Idh/MocA family oxidoreductase [Maribacter]MDC6405455.1 Gfo/Idh/MocA family oxidoreductase [Maribacter sp. PR66]MEE1972777.1 Gfo/Idh/MocA family oxidoreductase [Maribacter flavus]
MKIFTRRDFGITLGKGITATTLLGATSIACANGKKPQNKKLGVALVGLGSYSTYQLAPSLQDTEHCYLAGIVTGTKEKEKTWQEKYGIPVENTYNYENFDSIANNEAIDIVYVVLPNSMHADFSIRAAKAGKHVICEKPMAISVAECDAIIGACNKAGVKLSVGYRMQSDPYTKEVKKYVAEKTFGDVHFVSSDAGYISRGNPDQWRLNKKLSGGGALMNMGVYSIQTSIYGCGANPSSVSAQEFSTRPDYFKDTDETITAQFEFPNDAVAHMMTSHNANGNRLKSHCSNGWFELDPAHSYGPISGRTSNGNVISFPHQRQQALQMDDFAKHILMGTPNVAPGEMGKRDMIIVEAIYRFIAEGGKKQMLDLGNMGIVG